MNEVAELKQQILFMHLCFVHLDTHKMYFCLNAFTLICNDKASEHTTVLKQLSLKYPMISTFLSFLVPYPSFTSSLDHPRSVWTLITQSTSTVDSLSASLGGTALRWLVSYPSNHNYFGFVHNSKSVLPASDMVFLRVPCWGPSCL